MKRCVKKEPDKGTPTSGRPEAAKPTSTLAIGPRLQRER